jgi:hypothetical protein
MHNSDFDSAGARLRWARTKAGYDDAADFADAAKIKRVTYRAYENNQNGFAKHAAHFGSAHLLAGVHAVGIRELRPGRMQVYP